MLTLHTNPTFNFEQLQKWKYLLMMMQHIKYKCFNKCKFGGMIHINLGH